MSKNKSKDPKTSGSEKLKFEDALTINNALDVIGNLDIPDYDTSLAIERNIVILKPVLESYTTFLKSLVDKNVKKNNDGTPSYSVIGSSIYYNFISPKHKKVYNANYEKLNKSPIDVVLYKVKRSKLKEIVGLKSTIRASIHQIIEEDESDAKK